MKLRLPNDITILDENNVCIPNKTCSVVLDTVISSDILSLRVTADRIPLCYIELKWTFTEKERRDSKSLKILGDAWERGYGDLEWKCITPDRIMPWYCVVSNGSDCKRDYSERFTECFGVKVQPSAFCHWKYSCDELTLTLDIRNGGKGVILGGRTLNVAEVVFAEYQEISSYESVCRFCSLMCTSAILPQAPVFGFNDWYFSYGNSNEKMILDSARMLTERSSEYHNIPYMVIDDGWQINFNDGPWHIVNNGFSDMSSIAKKISDMGAKPGIWIRPLQQKSENPDIPSSWRLSSNKEALDPSNPEVLEYISDCIKRIVSWGFKLIKYDFVTYDIFLKWGFECTDSLICGNCWHFQDTSLTTAEIIINLYRTIRQAATGAILIGCNAVSHLCAGLVELNRTGDDTSGKEWERTLKMGVNTLAFRSPQNKAFYVADADCVGITDSIPFYLNEKWLYALSVSGSPMFVSVSADTSENIKQTVHKALKRNSIQTDCLVPLDWMETKTPCRWLLNGEEITINWNTINMV